MEVSESRMERVNIVRLAGRRTLVCILAIYKGNTWLQLVSKDFDMFLHNFQLDGYLTYDYQN